MLVCVCVCACMYEKLTYLKNNRILLITFFVLLFLFQVDWIALFTFFRVQVNWTLRGTKSPNQLASSPGLYGWNTGWRNVHPILITYGATDCLIRPFAIGACSAECAWDMATFGKRTCTQTSAAAGTGHRQRTST